MKPLNRAERNNAFFGFLLLFFITIGIVVTVVFLSIKETFRDNQQLRRKMSDIKKEKELSESFRVEMDGALNELKKFDLHEKPISVIQSTVEVKIQKMSRIVRNMPDDNYQDEKSMYNLMIQNIEDLSKAKLKIRNFEDQRN
jgi:hypothetical protein